MSDTQQVRSKRENIRKASALFKSIGKARGWKESDVVSPLTTFYQAPCAFLVAMRENFAPIIFALTGLTPIGVAEKFVGMEGDKYTYYWVEIQVEWWYWQELTSQQICANLKAERKVVAN